MQIDITKIIILVLIVAGFVTAIILISNSFKKKCTPGYTYNTNYNSCVPNCDFPKINNGPNGECGCPVKGQTGDDCQMVCNNPALPLSCGDQCYSESQNYCINNELCEQEISCGTKTSLGFQGKCCGLINGKHTQCSSQAGHPRAIVFTKPYNFVVILDQQKYIISIDKGQYNLDDDLGEFYYPRYLQNQINLKIKDKFTVNIVESDGITFKLKFIFTDKSSTSIPSLLFTQKEEINNFGFNIGQHSFNADNTLTSEKIEVYQCIEIECNEPGKKWCGNTCCDNDNCVNNIKCCSNKNSEICNGNCCPKVANTGETNCCEKGSKCCDNTNNMYCVNDKCQTKCLYPDKNGKPLTCSSDDKNIGCVDISDTSSGNYSYCGNAVCKFEQGGKFYNPDNVNGMPVCHSPLDPGAFSCISNTLKPKGPLSRTATAKAGNNCNENDCKIRMSDVGVIETIIKTDKNNLQLCEAHYDCDKLLPKCDDSSFIVPNGPNYCFEHGKKFTGQICPKDQYAIWNMKENNCECSSSLSPDNYCFDNTGTFTGQICPDTVPSRYANWNSENNNCDCSFIQIPRPPPSS